MLINCLIKKKHYISYIIDKNDIIIETIIKLLFYNIYKFHNLFLLLILNRDL